MGPNQMPRYDPEDGLDLYCSYAGICQYIVIDDPRTRLVGAKQCKPQAVTVLERTRKIDLELE